MGLNLYIDATERHKSAFDMMSFMH